MSAPTKPTTAPTPTWSAYETLPDGRERLLADHLRLTQVLAFHAPEAVWAVVWHEDSPAGR